MVYLAKVLFCGAVIALCLQTTNTNKYPWKTRNFEDDLSDGDQLSTPLQNKRTKAKEDDSKLCKTEACHNLEKSILSHMDKNVEPCNDMFMYACGGLVKTASHAKPKHDFSMFRELVTNQENLLKRAIEGLKNRKEKDVYKKVYDWYSACSNTPEKEKLGASPLLNILRSIGKWPLLDDDWNEADWDLEKVLALLYRKLGESPLFSVGVGNDARNVTGTPYKLKISSPSLPLQAVEFYLKKTKYSDQILFSYYELLLNLTKLLQKEDSAGKELQARDIYVIPDIKIEVLEQGYQLLDIMKEVIEVIKFEMDIAMAKTLEKKEYFVSRYTTLANLREAYEDDVFDWKRFISLLYKDLPNQPPFDDSEMIYIANVKFLEQIMKLVASTDQRIIANFLMIRILYEYGGALSNKFRDPYHVYYTAVYGIKKFSPTWKRCVRSTKKDVMYPVTALFVKETLPEPDLKKAEYLVSRLKASYLDHLDQVKWMDNITRVAAIKKVENMIAHVGYPREIRNTTALDKMYSKYKVYPLKYFDNVVQLQQLKSKNTLDYRGKTPKRNTWSMQLTQANAQYGPESNTITVAAGLLQQSLFHRDYPRARTFGSIGMAIGHEMTHGFDASGSRYDEIGNFKSWWSNETYAKFLKKIKCMEKEYSKFTVYGHHLNGKQTVDENIADNGGLRIAYEAYLKSLKERGPDLSLPDIDLPPKKLFFLSYSQLWCKYKTRSSAINSLHTDVHSPAKARVNIVLQNMKEFSKVFKCPKGSPMNPEKKCIVW